MSSSGAVESPHTYQRISQDAGRALYAWDTINNREQIIYGDTGQREVGTLTNSAYYDNTGFRKLYLRRVGNTVILNGQLGCTVSLANTQLAITLPAGFRVPTGGFEGTVLQIRASTALCRANIAADTGELKLYVLSGSAIASIDAGDIFNLSLSFMTKDAWPTSLPGTANGTIPNL